MFKVSISGSKSLWVQKVIFVMLFAFHCLCWVPVLALELYVAGRFLSSTSGSISWSPSVGFNLSLFVFITAVIIIVIAVNLWVVVIILLFHP